MELPRNIPPTVRSTYARELVSWSLLAVALGVLEGGVLGVMLKTLFAGEGAAGEGAGRSINYSVALLTGAPHFCGLLSFLWVRLGNGRDAVRTLVWMQLATAACLLLVAAAPGNAAGLKMMVAGAVGARLFWSGVVTLRAPVWRRTYPAETRARLTGRFFALHSIVMACTGFAAGSLLEANGSAYPLVYAFAAAVGIVGALAFSGLSRGEGQANIGVRQLQTSVGPQRPAGSQGSAEYQGPARPPWRDKAFRRYLFWLSKIHCGSLMFLGPLIVLLSDQLQLPESRQVMVTSSIPLLLFPLAVPLWTRLFDGGCILRFQAVNGIAFAAALLLLAWGAVSGSQAWLWGGAGLLGVAYAGGSVGFHLGTNRFAPRGRTLEYMGLHAQLSGLRGLLAPLVGITLYELLETAAPGQGAWALIVPIALSTLGALGFAFWAAERNEEISVLELETVSALRSPTQGTRRWLATDSDRTLLVLALTTLPVDAELPWDAYGPDDIVCKASSSDLDSDLGSERRAFWQVADWGVVPSQRALLVEHCTHDGDAASASSMRCTSDLRHCRARGLRLDVPALNSNGIDGKVAVSTSSPCRLSDDFPRSGIGLRGLTLSDWSPELQFFEGSDGERSCDVRIRRPTLLIKPDSRRNIYHGLCDHANLFLSMWIAGWQEVEDLEIIYWLPEEADERVRSPWYELFDAFTTSPVRPLGYYAGRSVCFDDAVLAVNPRSIGTFFYNMPVPGREAECRSGPGGFLRSFGERTKERLLPRPPRSLAPGDPVRIKIMSRSKGTGRTSGTRQVTNEVELAEAVRKRIPGVEVEIVNFDWNGRPPITGQVALMAETDVLVGMHGAGLVHTLWLPPWAVVFEIYNCGDVDTYRDLAHSDGRRLSDRQGIRRRPARPESRGERKG